MICKLSSIAMRQEPTHRSQMVSEVVYGEEFDIIASSEGMAVGEWCKIRNCYDGYEGWATMVQVMHSENYEPPETERRRACQIGLPYVDKQITEPCQVAMQCYLGTTYLWGGRTIGGIDCSGLTQMCYKACGKALPRDAYQQAECGTAVVSLQDAKAGDLCFFAGTSAQSAASNPKRPTHVGIYLGGDKIVHACGWVKVSTLTSSGIVADGEAADSGVYTHILLTIRHI